MDNGANHLARKALLYFGGGSALVLFLAVTFFGREPPTSSILIGTYTSECCGSLRLDEQTALVDGRAIPYEVGQSNQGVHLLPSEPIIIRNGKVMISPRDQLRFLPLNDRYEPTTVKVYDVETHEFIELVRR